MALKIWLWLKTDPWICWSSSVLDASWICTAAQNASSCWMAGANSETGIWHTQSFWLSAACSKYRPQHSAAGNVSLQDVKPHKLWSYWKKNVFHIILEVLARYWDVISRVGLSGSGRLRRGPRCCHDFLSCCTRSRQSGSQQAKQNNRGWGVFVA